MQRIEPVTTADIYLVRHGETLWNVTGRFQGIKNSPLTARGRLQGSAAGERLASLLKSENDVTLILSPLGRTQETGALLAVARNYTVVLLDDRIQEVSLGSWDGLSHREIDAEWPDALDGATAFDWYFRSPDGESLEATIDRALSWLKQANGTIVAVSHGLIGRVIRGVYLGLSHDEMLLLDVSPERIRRLCGGSVSPIAVPVPAS